MGRVEKGERGGYYCYYAFLGCFSEPVWPSVKALGRGTSVRFRFGSPLSSKVVVCGHLSCDFVPLS